MSLLILTIILATIGLIRPISSEVNENWNGWSLDDEDVNSVSEVLALFDKENNLVFYKDLSIPACFVEENVHHNSPSPVKMLSVSNDSIPIHADELRTKSKFVKSFCGDHLPIFAIKSTYSEQSLKRVHRNKRKKRDYRYYNNGNGGQHGYAQPRGVYVQNPQNTNFQHQQAQAQPTHVRGTYSGHAQSQTGKGYYYVQPQVKNGQSYSGGNSYSSAHIWSSQSGMRPGTTTYSRQSQGTSNSRRTLVLEPGQTAARQIRISPQGQSYQPISHSTKFVSSERKQQKLPIPSTWTKNIQVPENKMMMRDDPNIEYFGVRPEDDLEEQEYIGEGRGQRIGGTNGKIPIPMNTLPLPVPPGFRLVSRNEGETHTENGYLTPETGHSLGGSKQYTSEHSSQQGGSTGHVWRGQAHTQGDHVIKEETPLAHIEQSYPLAPPTPPALIFKKEGFDEPPRVIGDIPEGINVRVTKTQRHWVQNEGEPVLHSSSTQVFTNQDGQSSNLHEEKNVQQNGGQLALDQGQSRHYTRTEYTQDHSGTSGLYIPPEPTQGEDQSRSSTQYQGGHSVGELGRSTQLIHSQSRTSQGQSQGQDQGQGQGQTETRTYPIQSNLRNPIDRGQSHSSQQQPLAGSPQRCRLVTFTCTIVNNGNGRSKLCRPIVEGAQPGTAVQQTGQGEQQITCCCCC